jgi:hypothetical protein
MGYRTNLACGKIKRGGSSDQKRQHSGGALFGEVFDGKT